MRANTCHTSQVANVLCERQDKVMHRSLQSSNLTAVVDRTGHDLLHGLVEGVDGQVAALPQHRTLRAPSMRH